MSDLGPPWVLFVDKGRPVAILPAMRLGEVAKVDHLTMAEAANIVRLANELWRAIVHARLESVARDLAVLTKRLKT